MTRNHSPLRYPGGKSILYELVRDLILESNLHYCNYAEPFAGGCGLALRLLMDGVVSRIHINDIDLGVWSFWHSVLNDAEALCRKIRETPVTVEERSQQRAVFLSGEGASTLDLGFATFFLNRTNRSGIIKSGGVIGGNDQKGAYKIDCRFNKGELVERIERVAMRSDCIDLSRKDALCFLTDFNSLGLQHAMICIDPPYFHKGSSLYTNFYRAHDHAILAQGVRALSCPWFMTYDNAEEIRSLYSDYEQYTFNIQYSAQEKRSGRELLIHSSGIKLPEHNSFKLMAA